MKRLLVGILSAGMIAGCGRGHAIFNVDVLSFLSSADSTKGYNVLGGIPQADSTVSRQFTLPPGFGKSSVDSVTASLSSVVENATGGGRVTLQVFFGKQQTGLFTGTPYLTDSTGHLVGADTVFLGTNKVSLSDSVFNSDSVWVGIRARISTDAGPAMTGHLRLTDMHVRIVLDDKIL
jgi:hypothetical protein